ncbi:unnamed protein product [Didymodactylos carnosus]|uniref:Uncharacterized protein n=1 Tax=Didymodactylos carnosus TaxID=1234261 RepID=A0A815ED50_9BILA|nr:unnamed protein product [Didymodactylos carnosus]CAF1338347.1 unnamed protein product [Didymodactylos carnosus]CAF4137213.1 unnamed protein product [Didymodactylos carnosus]CAF4149636.1 unnamed protein product [Didymodactylos carnosus]
MDFIKNTIEKKTGMDLDKDGRVGGGTGTQKEIYTFLPITEGHILFFVKGQKLPGQHGAAVPGQHTGGVGGGFMNKAEQLTRFDINNDGRIGDGQRPQ